MLSNYAAARAILQDACCEINPSGGWPLDLEPLLERFGIVYRHTSNGERRGVAYLQIGDTPTITLVRSCPGENGKMQAAGETRLSRRDRFSVAHELAHYLLWQRGGILPATNRSQYWQHEALCNEFAGHLLVHRQSLQTFLGTVDPSVPAADYPRLVAKKADVTWPVAARAISAETQSQLCYLRVAPRQDNLDFLRVDCSSLSFGFQNFAGQAAHLYDKEVCDSLLLIKQVTEGGHGFLYKLPVTLSFGNLHLNNVPCKVLYQAGQWILQFTAKRTDMVAKINVSDMELVGEGELNEGDDSITAKRASGLSRLTSGQANTVSVSEEPLVTPVQRMAIKRLMSNCGMSSFEEAKTLTNRFLKIKVDHLTVTEGAILMQELQQK